MSVLEKEKPQPEKDEKGFRIITEDFCKKLCYYNGGYDSPKLNVNLYLHFQGFLVAHAIGHHDFHVVGAFLDLIVELIIKQGILGIILTKYPLIVQIDVVGLDARHVVRNLETQRLQGTHRLALTVGATESTLMTYSPMV